MGMLHLVTKERKGGEGRTRTSRMSSFEAGTKPYWASAAMNSAILCTRRK